MPIVIASRNPSKVKQIAALIADGVHAVLSQNEVGVVGEAVEDGETLEQNALKKARFAHAQCGHCCIADDTGLFIDALNGEPGIHAARWAGDDATTEEIMHFTLLRLRRVPLANRTATFKTVAALVLPNRREHLFVGEVRGVLLETPRVPCQPKMPYSALFVPDGQSKVWAEMTVVEENAISHRGRAFMKVKEFLARRK